MANSLNLIFGPTMPPEYENIGLAFIGATSFTPSDSITALSAERYVAENYSAKYPINIVPAIQGEGTLQVNVGGINSGVYWSDSEFVTLDSNNEFSISVAQTPIKVIGTRISPANTWGVLIQPGLVWRSMQTLTAADVTSGASWIAQSGRGEGDTIIPIYSVPEHLYAATTSSSVVNFPGSGSTLKIVKEFGGIPAPNTVSFSLPLVKLLSISVNGVVKSASAFEPGDNNSFINTIDKEKKTIITKSALDPKDLVELTYLTYANWYNYTGYRDVNNTWFGFDANPEYGHYIDYVNGDGETIAEGTGDCLLNQATIYLIPSAYVLVKYTPPSYGGQGAGMVDLSFHSAYDYGETHFVRHTIGYTQENIVQDLGQAPNTYNFAVFGKNYYDQPVAGADSYSADIPFMFPIGKILLSAPVSIKNLAVVDVRKRGGGVPEDFPMQAVDTQAEGLEKLRGFFDLSIWEGSVIKEGGVIEIKIDTSVLNRYTADEVYEIVKNNVVPGLDFEIVYVDGV